jgi:hypothetical protein
MESSIIDEVYEEIKKRNEKVDLRAVPHSDDLLKFITSSMGIDIELVRKLIRVLITSHKVFSMEIVAEDKSRNVPRVEGYVVADINVIRRLKSYYQHELMTEFEHQVHKRLLIHQILKEMLPILKSYNNTLLGQLTNKAIMLEEYERLLEKNFSEYTEEWQQVHLQEEMDQQELGPHVIKRGGTSATGNGKKAAGETPANRAVDSQQYKEYMSKSKNYPLQRILRIYGLKFFVQVNLRKYQFEYLCKLVNDGQINRRADLMQLRELINTVKNNINSDLELKKYVEQLYDLERVVTHKIFFSTGSAS